MKLPFLSEPNDKITREIVIESENKKLLLDLRELIHYSDLFWILAYRDFRIRYAQTFLGFFWAFIQPVLTLGIFIVVFQKAAKVDTGEIPYPLFAVCGQSVWTYFSFVLNQSGNSIISAQAMVKKVFFPRLIIPLSKAIVGFIDFSITFILIISLLIYYQYLPSPTIIFFPVFLIFSIFSSLAVGIWFSAISIRFRDFQHVIPFMVQFGLYVTPIGYPSELVTENLPEWLSFVYFLNPVAGAIEGFRWSILGGEILWNRIAISFIVSIVLFISSLFYFKRVEKIMADII